MDKSFYNLASSEKLGWKPDWFGRGLSEFDEDLEEAIAKFQKEHKLKADGLCGPSTFRRIITDRESRLENGEKLVEVSSRKLRRSLARSRPSPGKSRRSLARPGPSQRVFKRLARRRESWPRVSPTTMYPTRKIWMTSGTVHFIRTIMPIRS